EMAKKLDAAKDRMRALMLPPLERQTVQQVGGLKVFEAMTPAMQAAARAETVLTKTHELAAASFEAGGRRVNVYAAALTALGRTAQQTRNQIADVRDNIADAGLGQGDLALR